MDEDTEFVKLPIEDRCVHKLWKARVHGYEEAAKLFQQIADEKSPEWNKFLGLVKKFVIDSNAVAQEKGLEAVLAFVENSFAAGKTVCDVMSGIVSKCIGAPKAKTKDLAAQISLMYIEIEKQDLVMEELLKGTEHKNPKVVASCINVITQAIREFGVKVINIKPLLKKIPSFLEDRDKTVRDEGKTLVVEMYRWIGPALNPQLSSVKPVQMTELEAEFDKVKGDKAVPTRYLRSQQAKQAKIAAEAANEADGGDEDADDGGGAEEIDPYELMEPVDILSKLPKDFYEKVEAKKWQERKEAMDTLEGILKAAPKLENGDYFELVKVLKKIISKDSNVVVVTLAGKNLAGLANGLKKRFQQHAHGCVSVILEKFREKKTTVVAALREAIDAVYPATTLETIQEDVLSALENKNPSVKSETASFLARCFTKCTPANLNKKLLKAYSTVLVKTLNESDPVVRDSSAEALGTAMKVVGEKALLPFLGDVDSLKMSKIKEFCDKAELVVKQPKPVSAKAAASADRPASAPTKAAGSVAPKPVKRPPSAKKGPSSSSQTSKKGSAPSSAGGKVVKSGSGSSAKQLPTERELSDEEVSEKALAVFSSETISGLADSNWKTRLSAVEQFSQVIGTLDQSEVSSQLLFRVINKKPGVKDTNIQVAKMRLESIKAIAGSFPISSVAMSCVLLDVAERLNDPKLSSLAAECLTAISEATKLDLVSTEVLDYAFNSQKSPKVQVEVLTWLSNAIQEFGFQVQAKSLMENVKKGVSATNPTVRTAAISLLGTLYIYMGPQLGLFFENEKPALLQQINAEFEKHAGQVPKSPVRGVRKARSQGDLLDDREDDGDECGGGVPNIQDIVPRTDITSYITDTLVSEMSDKNWKVRAEALQKLQNIVSELRFISGSLGEAGPALAARLVDSNSKIAATAIALCQQIGTAYGSSCKQYIRVFFPGFLQGMGDSKSWIRTAAIECINTYGDLGGYKEFFDGEMIYDALKGGSPTLRSELWAWLAEKLPKIKSVPKEELIVCLPLLFSNVEDRNADVRKNASEAIVGIMTHIGYSPMMSASEKLKPASASQVRLMLDKARGSLPEKPTISKAKSSQSINKVGVDNNKMKLAPGSSNTIVKSSSKTKVNPNVKGPGGNKKKDDDNESSAPLLQVNNLKNQRCIDEQKLKTLKWNFTTPREEFVELLRDQMTAANVNKGLIANMFHADFKYHLRAIDALNEDLPSNQQALISNLDLILKWMTLRFFDTNPSVILKGLEYLQTAFGMLIEGNYMMLENEAASFLPYLVLKVGDPKDTVRNSVRALFKQITLMYPVSRLFTYVMDGLKSKNARQRSECLEQLGNLIDSYELTVCQPTPAAALKEIAKHISDRDNSVRNGALNCVVSAYFLGGERILKMVGQISDKDMSLLEERIKRAAKSRVAVATVRPMVHQPQPQQQTPARPQSAHVPNRQSTSPLPDNDYNNDDQPHHEYVPQNQPQSPPQRSNVRNTSTNRSAENHYSPVNNGVNGNADSDNSSGTFGYDQEGNNNYYDSSMQRSIYKLELNEVGEVVDSQNGAGPSDFSTVPQPVSGPYGLDLALLENIESVPLNYEPPKLVEFDLHFLDEPSRQITSPLRLTTTSSISPLSKMTHPATIEWHLSQIANSNLEKALSAMSQIETILLSEQRNSLQDHIDYFVTQLVNQLVLLNQCNHPDIVNCYRTNFSLFMKLYNYPELSYKVSEGILRRAVDQLLCLLTEKKLEMYDHTEMFARVVNSLVIRILERSDRTSVVCALLKILYDTVNNTATTQLYQELVMKCLWKVVKNFNDWDEDLDYNRILTDVHTFLRDYPSAWWKKQPQDTALRTVKTVLHTMVKLRGSETLIYVRQIKGVTPESEIQTYCNKLIKTIKPVGNSGDAPHTDKKENSKPKHMSKSISDQLSEIFLKIGSKHDTKEGLKLLYEFKQLHPEADIEPFLEKSTKFFQDYIQRGLQAIEMEHRRASFEKKNPVSQNMIPVMSEKGEGETNNKFDREEVDIETQQFVKRLRILQAKAGWSSAGSESAANSVPTSVTTTSSLQSQNSNLNSDIDALPTVRNTSLESNNWRSPERAVDVEDFEAIRKRLAKLKKDGTLNL